MNYSNVVDSNETLPLAHEQYSWVSKDLAMSSESEVGLIYPSVVCHKSRHTLPHSIIRGVII